MKILLICCALLFCAGCVQKVKKQTVVYILDASGNGSIQSATLRGSDKPLDWNADMNMKELKKDSLYTATVTYNTGYLFTEVKFLLNGNFELSGRPNRRILFSDKDTTIVQVHYNK
jgi:putative oxidoreductase